MDVNERLEPAPLITGNENSQNRNKPRSVPAPVMPGNLLELVRVVKAPAARTPFPIQAMAVEEDTSLVLSADTEVRDPREHPIRLMTALYNDPHRTPGTIVVKNACPTYLLAIIHDFDQQPSWREAWVASCLEKIFGFCGQHQISALGLEPLGTKHGRLAEKEFLQLLCKSMRAAAPSSLRRIWVVAANSQQQHRTL